MSLGCQGLADLGGAPAGDAGPVATDAGAVALDAGAVDASAHDAAAPDTSTPLDGPSGIDAVDASAEIPALLDGPSGIDAAEAADAGADGSNLDATTPTDAPAP